MLFKKSMKAQTLFSVVFSSPTSIFVKLDVLAGTSPMFPLPENFSMVFLNPMVLFTSIASCDSKFQQQCVVRRKKYYFNMYCVNLFTIFVKYT